MAVDRTDRRRDTRVAHGRLDRHAAAGRVAVHLRAIRLVAGCRMTGASVTKTRFTAVAPTVARTPAHNSRKFAVKRRLTSPFGTRARTVARGERPPPRSWESLPPSPEQHTTETSRTNTGE